MVVIADHAISHRLGIYGQTATDNVLRADGLRDEKLLE